MRTALQPGSRLLLGGVEYTIEAVEGSGSSAVVYRAAYEDALNRGALHRVLIKELFPLSAQGGIERAPDGGVVCTGPGLAVMEEAKRRFLMGNQVNLELLAGRPEATAGNLNSFDARGTYYSVLSLHGGESLLRALDSRGRFPLREAAEVMLRLLGALAVFHRRGLLHLDVSPDNILLLPGQALLIDFNSVWDTRRPDWGDFCFSCKPGYSAPEVLLGDEAALCPATDIYSCGAVFFHLLSGRRLREGEAASGGFRRGLAGLPCLAGVPQSAASKAAEILLRALHALPRRRYADAQAMAEELGELLARLDGFGVSPSALWEAGAARLRRERAPQGEYLDQPLAAAEGETLPRPELELRLDGGGRFLLTGPGGMGKSRLLLELAARRASVFRPGEPVYILLPLRGYQTCPGEADYIRRSLLRLLRFAPGGPGWEDALHALEALFDSPGPGGGARLVLLLDGLNEAGPRREKLLAELEELGSRPGLGLLVTERSSAVLEYALGGFEPLALSPLSEAQLEIQLGRRGLPLPAEEGLRRLLATPMLLFLYLDAAQAPGEGAPAPETQEALVALYLEQFCRRALREDSGSQGAQLCTAYLLRHFLPDAAALMRRLDRSLLQAQELLRLAERSRRELHGRSFGEAFPEFMGKSRLMFEGIGSAAEWYDFAVGERLTERFGLLREAAPGQYALLHDNFLDVLAGQADENRRRLSARRGAKLRRGGAALLAALLLLGGAGAALGARLHARTGYTESEEGLIYDAVAALNSCLGLWSSQVSAQRQLLERASVSDVLDNEDAAAREALAGMIAQQRSFLASLYAAEPDAELYAALAELEAGKGLFSTELLAELCGRWALMEPAAEAGMARLEAVLCEEDSAYDSRDKRERLVSAYAGWLEAETRYVSYLLAELLSQMAPEQQEQALEAMAYMEAFEGFYDGAGSVSPERLPAGAEQALETLKESRRQLSAQGLSLPGEWE